MSPLNREAVVHFSFIFILIGIWYLPLLNSFAGSFAIGLCNRTAEQYIKGAPGVVVAEMAFHLQFSSE